MPVNVIGSTYYDGFGATIGSTYTSNAGDITTMDLYVSEQIRVSTVSNPFTFDPILNILTSPAQSWLQEGFRAGDTVAIFRYDSAGAGIAGHTATVSSVTDTELNVDTWTSGLFYDNSAGDIMVVICLEGPGLGAKRRDDLYLEFNQVINSSTGAATSLIDGEVTTVFFDDLKSLPGAGTRIGNIVGKQSGQFLISAQATYTGTDTDSFNTYTIRLVFANSGIYNKDWFDAADCLKNYIKGLWAANAGEVFNRSEFIYSDNANTGWFDEANNVSVATGGSVITSIDELQYNVAPNNVTFEVDLAGTNIADLAIGGAYVSIDDEYYKNQVYNQNNLTYLLPTTTIAAATTYTSNNGVGSYSAGNWEITVNSITPSGGNAIIDLDWSCNSTLQDFFESRDEDDKFFYLWIKIGNTNHLVYSEQLVKVLPVGGPLTMNSDYGFLDHSQNSTSIAGDHTGFTGDTEDDIAYYGTFNLELNKTTYNSINLRVEAYNTTTEDAFTLQQSNFNFGGVTFQASTGKYLLNETATINTELPTTSNKRSAEVKLTGVDDLTTYEVSVYYPFLLNWKYWLPLSGVSTDFAPDENQNWEQYDNLGDWQIRMVVELDDDGLAFVHTNTLIDNPYDNNADVNSTIELKRQLDDSVVSIIPEGELLFIESTHELTTGNWDPLKMWGMITVEPKEGAPRWIMSTIVPFDGNSSNPLRPISGLLTTIDYLAANIITLKCQFDPSKIDLSNGVKITAKVKQVCLDITEVSKETTSDDDKYTTDDDLKIIA